jgi:hypothetical protein
VAARFNGRLDKTPGDWIMVAFASSADALRPATEMQIDRRPRNTPTTRRGSKSGWL